MVKTQDDIGSAEEYRQYLQSSADGWDSAAVGKLLSDGNSDKVIAELANLSKLDYGRRRKTAAKAMGVPVAILDEVVIEHRTRREVRDAALPHWTVEAWPEVVDGAALLNEITEILKQYVVLPEHIPETVALWVVHTWTFGASEISPYLAPISPTKRCGKTSLLVLLNWLTRRSEIASNISSAALFRYIEEHHPTLLVDEADSFLESNEELRGVLNSGHTRAAAYVIRCDGQDNKPRRFSTWAPKAIALIGRLPETLADRSIIVAMKRKRRDEKVARLRRRDCEAYAVIRQKSLRWANDNRDALEQADPKELPSLNDRAMDNWRPLLAIADRAGGDWIELATKAALALSGDETDAAENIRVELLADIQRAFGADDRLWTTTLLAELAKHPERP